MIPTAISSLTNPTSASIAAWNLPGTSFGLRSAAHRTTTTINAARNIRRIVRLTWPKMLGRTNSSVKSSGTHTGWVRSHSSAASTNVLPKNRLAS